MCEPKFTNGEWNVQFGDMIFASNEIVNEQVAVVCNEENQDKYLIAAAPELYELLDEMAGYDECQRFKKQINELLAKARGEHV